MMNRSIVFRGLLIIAIGIILTTILSVDVGGKTITVTPDGSGDYQSIQDAVDAAEAGDTIRVHGGEYNENVILNKSLTMIGNGSEATILVGNGSGVGIYFSGLSAVTIEDMGFKDYEHGIHLYESTDSTISHVSAMNCTGNGIYVQQMSNSNVIVGNTADSNFIGIKVYNSHYNHIINNSVSENGLSGINVQGQENIITDNTANNNGRGIHLNLAPRNTVTNNIASYNTYHGLRFSYSRDNIIQDNTAIGNSGGIRLSSDSSDNTLQGNMIQSNDRGFDLEDSDRNTITNSTINGNLIGIYLTAQSENNSAHYNNFFNNSQFGVNASSDSGINATDNWWGHKTGPYHATNNSDGEGENVTDHVVFDPWVNDRIYWIPTVYLDLISPNPAIHLQTVQFRGHSSDEDKIIRYVWRSSIDGELSNGTNSDHSTNELSVGEHTIFFKAQNENGNWSEEVTSQFIITNKPVAKIESITPNPVLAGERVIFKANSTDEDGTIDLYHWSSSIDGVFMQSRGNQFYNDSMSSGVHEIFHKVQDNNGIWSDEVSMDLTIAIKPVASIQSITPNPALTTHDIEFSAQVTICDCPGDIQEYVWNSSMEGELYRGEEHQFSMNGLSEGNHTISLQIQDNNGFWSDVINETLLIVHKPVVQIGEITPDPALEMAMTTFSIAQLDCRCGPDNITTYNWRSDINGELYNGSNMSFTYYGLFKGNHSIFLVAQDSNGFWSDEVSTTLEVKGRPYITGIGLSSAFNPIYTPDSPGVTHNFTIDATDDDGWITRYAITTSLDGEIYNGTNPYFETANLSVGEHTIFFKAMNNEGIWSSWRIHAHPLVEPPRNHIPTISIEAPSNNENVSGTILIRMVVDDVDGNISRVYVSVDGGIWYPPSGDRWNYTLDTGTLTEGTHTISVKSYDGIHYSNITTITINVEHLEDDDDDNSFWLTFGIAFIVTAVVTFTLIKLYSKK